MKNLTHKQRKFVLEYMKTGNATESYKNAGYSASNDNIAGVEGHKLLRHPKIKEALQEQVKNYKENAVMDAEEVLAELTKVARGETKEEVLIGMGHGVQDITEKGSATSDRLRALELLGRRYALFTDNVNNNTEIEGGIKVVVDYGESN